MSLVEFLISIFFISTTYYLSFIHENEKYFSDIYKLYGERINCYSFAQTYTLETLSRGERINIGDINDVAQYQIERCFDLEKQYLDLLVKDD